MSTSCATDIVNLWPTYRRSFDIIFQRVKNEEWSALADDFRTLVLVGNVADLDFPHVAPA